MMEEKHPPTERPILQRIDDGLKKAVEADPDLEWQEEGTRTRRQKYTVRAVEYFTRKDDSPVLTSSWYKYGKTYPAAPSWPSDNPGPFQNPQLPKSEIHTIFEDDITHFFTYQVDRPKLNGKYWYMETLDLLENFYNWHAPDRYRNLYLANIELRRVFRETSKEISSLRESQSRSKMSFSDFGNSQSVDYYKRVGKAAARIHMELATTTELEEALTPVREFTDLIEDVFMMLAKVPQKELTAAHQRVVNSLEEFYSSTAWEYPAALLMRETANGPNSDWVRHSAEVKTHTLRDSFENQLEQERRFCADAGLLPDVTEYPEHNDEAASSITGMMRTLDGRDG